MNTNKKEETKIEKINPNILEHRRFNGQDVYGNNTPRPPYRFLDLVDVQNIGKRTYAGKKEFIPYVRLDEKGIELMNKSMGYLVKTTQQDVTTTSAINTNVTFDDYYGDSGDLSYIENVSDTIVIKKAGLYKLELGTTLKFEPSAPILGYTVYIDSDIQGALMNSTFGGIGTGFADHIQYKSEQRSGVFVLSEGEILSMKIYSYNSGDYHILGSGETYMGIEIKKFSRN